MKIFSISLGCPKNLVDAERLLFAFGLDFQPAETPEEADCVLINTCSFITPAVEESVQTILENARRIKDLTPRPPLVVAGCLVSRYKQEDLALEMPEVDLWLSPAQLEDWPSMLVRLFKEKSGGLAGSVQGRRLSTGPSYAYLKISEGCRHRCSYCLIPDIRGRDIVSRPLPELLDEARFLLEQGVSEIILVAQDLTAWGDDLGLKHGLRELLPAFCRLEGLKRLRLMYLHPSGLNKAMLSFMADLPPPFLPYFDLPFQHSHPEMLRLMNRPLSPSPRRMVELIREHLPEAALRSTLITGFPGEKEEHFADMLDFVKTAQFMHLGVFTWQAEEGSAAFSLPERVNKSLAGARRRSLLLRQLGISRRLLAGLLGQDMDILVERPQGEWPGLYIGRAWFQAPEVDGVVYVSGPGVIPGSMVRARVEESRDYDLTAMVL